jgi:N-acetylglutamate synthase-like GNAT family acetyltransferase
MVPVHGDKMIDIRPATLADIPALHRLVERAYRGDSARKGWTHEADLLGGQRTDVEGLRAIIADPAQRLLIAISSGNVVGCVQVSRKDADTAYLGLLSVDPDAQAGGLGKALIVEAEHTACAVFAASIMEMTVIHKRSELIAYYERRGYALTGETRPFPLDDERFGLPVTRDLSFVVLAKRL